MNDDINVWIKIFKHLSFTDKLNLKNCCKFLYNNLVITDLINIPETCKNKLDNNILIKQFPHCQKIDITTNRNITNFFELPLKKIQYNINDMESISSYFGHFYDKPELFAKIPVEDLLEQNKHLKIYCCLCRGIEYGFHTDIKDDNEIIISDYTSNYSVEIFNKCLSVENKYIQESIIYVKKNYRGKYAYHCGDCTYVACTCDRCCLESLYLKSVRAIIQFISWFITNKDMILNDAIMTKFNLDKENLCKLLLLLEADNMTNYMYNYRKHLRYNTGFPSFPNDDETEFNFTTNYKHLLSLPDDKQQQYVNILRNVGYND
jgi:hypothetical protein